MDKKQKQKIISLGKFVRYVLLNRPDEFGLFLSEDGSVSIKEFLQAMHEEEGWRYVRRSHLQEIFLIDQMPGFIVDGNRIKADDHGVLQTPVIYPEIQPPKLLLPWRSEKNSSPHYEQGNRDLHRNLHSSGIVKGDGVSYCQSQGCPTCCIGNSCGKSLAKRNYVSISPRTSLSC